MIAVSSAIVPNVVSWMLVSQTCIIHREEDQELHRNGCGSGLKFLY